MIHLDAEANPMTTVGDFMIAGKAGKLAVRAKGLERAPRNVVVLVQGANLSGQAGFDFSFPGGDDYSMMDMFVARGLGAVTFSVRGYATSDAPADPFTVDTDAAIEDLGSVMAWVRDRGYGRPHLSGWSWGGRITARYTERNPAEVGRLALQDPALGGGNRILPAPTECWWSGGWDYFHDRLESEYTDAAARRALADFVVAQEPRSPNGIRLENARGSVPPVAAQITRPTMLIYGSAAGQQNYMQGGLSRTGFFEALATRDKVLAVIPECGDYAHFQKPRKRFASAVADFLLAD
jgi:pimeloyl-ACP methyl ester carboxylesterase